MSRKAVGVLIFLLFNAVLGEKKEKECSEECRNQTQHNRHKPLCIEDVCWNFRVLLDEHINDNVSLKGEKYG